MPKDSKKSKKEVNSDDENNEEVEETTTTKKSSKNTKVEQQTEHNSDDVRTIQAEDVNIKKNFSIGPVLDSDEDVTQNVAFPRYKYPPLKKGGEPDVNRFIVVTKPMHMLQGGIPKIHEKWRPTDDKCMYFWLPHIPEDEGSNELFTNVFNPLDEFLKENATSKDKDGKPFIHKIVKGVPKGLGKLHYSAGVKKFIPGKSDDDDGESDDGKDKTTSQEYNRIKVRFALVYDKAKKGKQSAQKIKTRLYLNNDDGTPRDEPEPADTLAEFRKHFVWKSKVQFVLEINKFWIKKDGDQKLDGKKECSWTVKCLQLLVLEKPATMGASLSRSVFGNYGVKKQIKNDSDDEDDDDDDNKSTKSDESEEDTKTSKKVKNAKDSKKGKDTKKGKKDESDDDSASYSEKEEEKVTSKKQKDSKNAKDAKKGKKDESESENEEDSGKSDDEEEDTKKKSKKEVKGKGKKVESESESDSDSSDSDSESEKDTKKKGKQSGGKSKGK
jgi:hypothetical protein